MGKVYAYLFATCDVCGIVDPFEDMHLTQPLDKPVKEYDTIPVLCSTCLEKVVDKVQKNGNTSSWDR